MRPAPRARCGRLSGPAGLGEPEGRRPPRLARQPPLLARGGRAAWATRRPARPSRTDALGARGPQKDSVVAAARPAPARNLRPARTLALRLAAPPAVGHLWV